MAKVWDKPITADTDWGGDASTENLPVSGRQVQAWIKSNIKSDAQISQLIVSWLNKNTINSPAFWKGLPIDADTLKWENNTLTVIGSDGETEAVIDEEFLINFLKENGYLTKGDYPFVYDAEKKVWLFTGDLITTGAITMFGSIEGFTPSTIMDAVQVDGRTIVKNAAGQLVAIGGGGSGGGLIVDDVNALIEAALVPVQEEIGLKWTEDSDSIYRWNLAFSWGDHSKEGYALKTYVDDELTKYILLDTAQDVNAQHNFKKGLFIDGLPITKVNSNTIFLDANLVIGGAITMFGNNSSTFKAIWENIPFDSTMQWNGSTWSVVGGGGSSINESAVNLLIGEYLTNNNYASEQWVSNQGYAKQSSLNGVDNRLKSVETFFATSDTDNLVNKWSEIVTFLNATEGDTLDNILKTKANQSALDDAVASLTTEIGKKWTQNDVKIANWDSAYGWGNHANAGYAAKTYVDGELAKHVKLATAQTISARHNFSDGLQIGGITIRKSQDGVVYIDGNLVIKGALTMFGTDTTIPSSIWASIPFDSTMKWDGSKWSVVGGGSGSVDAASVNVLISEYLAKNSYATQLWVQNQGYLTTHQSISHLLSKTDAANTYQPIINSSNKLAYSLISGTPDLSVYFRSSDFSKANIKSTLGISDWALAATKPSYTAAEVGALSINGGAIGRGLSNAFPLEIYSTSDYSGIAFCSANGTAYLRFQGGNKWGVTNAGWTESYDLIHSGNIGQQNVASADAVTINYSQSDANYNLLFTNQADQWVSKVDAVYRDNRNKLYYNPSAGALTATSFVGNLTGNAGSATKLQTARTIWGQSFDGTADISGTIKNVDVIRNARSNWIIGEASLDGEVHIGSASFAQARTLYNANGMLSLLANGTFRLLRREDTPPLMHSILTYEAAPYGLLTRINTDGSVSLQAQREANDAECFRLLLNPLGGNVAIGGTTADARLHVHGDAIVTGDLKLSTGIISGSVFTFLWDSNKVYIGTKWYNTILRGSAFDFVAGDTTVMQISADGNTTINGSITTISNTSIIKCNDADSSWQSVNVLEHTWTSDESDGLKISIPSYEVNNVYLKLTRSKGAIFNSGVTINGNLLATGAITMFSQLSMKNVIDYDGLSLAQLAQIKPARFTWKDGRDTLVHAGGIADDVMQVLPEVIYQTSDGKLTMDYGSAAFYVGASLIKPVIDHEKRIAELERENKRKDEVIVMLQNKLNQLSA